MNTYKVLNKQVYSDGDISLVPIRLEDRYDIMKWRNEQIYHLRQNKPLTKDDQDKYFTNNVAKLFDQEKPKQILFSYLREEQCIGYGGLVHINWVDRNAELSFIMNTSLERENFEFHWFNYLNLILDVAFTQLNLHKIYTYALDLRPHLYPIFLEKGFTQEAILKEHAFFDNRFVDVVIHSKLNFHV